MELHALAVGYVNSARKGQHRMLVKQVQSYDGVYTVSLSSDKIQWIVRIQLSFSSPLSSGSRVTRSV
jgi:hypothetical protein